jgi:hypothetical protein
LSLSQCRKMVLVISLTQVVWTLKHSDLMPNLRPGAKLTRFQSKMFWFDLIEINYSWFPRTPNQVTLCASTGGKLVCFSSAKGYVCLSFLLLLLTFRNLLRVWGPTTKNLDMLTSWHCLHSLACQCHKHNKASYVFVVKVWTSKHLNTTYELNMTLLSKYSYYNFILTPLILILFYCWRVDEQNINL